MRYTYEEVVEKISNMTEKYSLYNDKAYMKSEIEVCSYGLKVHIHVIDLHPKPVDVADVTIRLRYDEEHPILDAFLETIEFTMAKLIDLYENDLPEIGDEYLNE